MSATPPSPSNPPNERVIFLEALARPEADREAYLLSACGSDVALRDRVRSLIEEQACMGDTFLQTPALGAKGGTETVPLRGPGGTELSAAVLTEKEGDRIGRYKLLQKIGEGGCGIVYMADQEEPVRRRVALKVIKLGMDTRGVIARFEAERQALAMMDHPNIAKVLDAGATSTGRPYFVMELVRGIRITDYCDENNLPTTERLDLFRDVCRAIHHAHQKGIIHRDIKPSNILVTLHDGRPVPKVIDFGIAKATEQRLTEKTLFTEFAAFIGTPAYMSPEQAEMSGLDIDTRSDIYSLGVLLYELLTGQTPFDPGQLMSGGLDACRRTIREEEPVRPSTRLATMIGAELTTTARQRRTDSGRLIHQIRGDLDWVVMRCLEKDRTRRYASANDLALDVERYLDDEPVEARPPSSLYRLGKLIHRNRGAFSAAAVIALLLVAGAGIGISLAVRATRAEHDARLAGQAEARLRRQAEGERERAERESAAARLNEYVADINLAQQSLAAGHLGRALQLLEKHRPNPGEQDLRGFEWRHLWQLCQGDEHVALPEQRAMVQSVAFDPLGRWLAVGLQGELNIYRLPGYTLVTNLPKGALSLAPAPDGRWLVAASASTVRAWDTTGWTELRALPENFGPVSLSADGRLLATSSRHGAVIWNTADWSRERELPDVIPPVAFSPDARFLAAETVDLKGLAVHPIRSPDEPVRLLSDSTNLFFRGGVALFPGRTRPRTEDAAADWTRAIARMGPRFSGENALAISRDGSQVVAARNSLSEWGVFIVSFWDVVSGVHATMPPDPEHIEHTGSITALAFSPDGQFLATASADHSIRIWNFKTRQRVATLQGHTAEVRAITFSPDGRTIASGGRDGSVRLWPIRSSPKEDVIPGTWHPLAFSPDSRTLAVLNKERALTFLNLNTREPEVVLPMEAENGRGRMRFGGPALAISADLTSVAHLAAPDTVNVLNLQTRDTQAVRCQDGSIDSLALSRHGEILVGQLGRARGVRIWNLSSGLQTNLPTDAVRIQMSADDRWLGLVTRSNVFQVWDLKAHRLHAAVQLDSSPATDIAFSEDGQRAAVGANDDTIRIIDVIRGEVLGTCAGHRQRIWSVAFSPDGRTLASVGDDSTLKLWNVPTQQELLTIRRLGGSVRELLFSPDGGSLVGSRGLFSRIGGLRFYRAPSLAEIDARPVGLPKAAIEGGPDRPGEPPGPPPGEPPPSRIPGNR